MGIGHYWNNTLIHYTLHITCMPCFSLPHIILIIIPIITNFNVAKAPRSLYAHGGQQPRAPWCRQAPLRADTPCRRCYACLCSAARVAGGNMRRARNDVPSFRLRAAAYYAAAGVDAKRAILLLCAAAVIYIAGRCCAKAAARAAAGNIQHAYGVYARCRQAYVAPARALPRAAYIIAALRALLYSARRVASAQRALSSPPPCHAAVMRCAQYTI